jgi:hypothetical protein
MNMEIRERFITLWRRYFNQAELPLVFYYQQKAPDSMSGQGGIPRCIIGALAAARKGKTLTLDINTTGCPGGRKYLGFSSSIMPEFNYFLSCGIPGKVKGERYKKSPATVEELVKRWPVFQAPGPYITFKRWDMLGENDIPEVAVFFAGAEVLAGLFTLFNYDWSDPQAVITPMASGCSSIVTYPYLEKESPRPRAVIGMFDPSARPMVEKEVLTFALPYSCLMTMLDNMEESFLITEDWKHVQKRIP